MLKLIPILLVLSACSLGSLGGGSETPTPKPPPESESPEVPKPPDSSWETTSFLDKMKGKYLLATGILSAPTQPGDWLATVESDGGIYFRSTKVRRHPKTQLNPTQHTYAMGRSSTPDTSGYWYGAELKIEDGQTNLYWMYQGGERGESSWYRQSDVIFYFNNRDKMPPVWTEVYKVSDTRP